MFLPFLCQKGRKENKMENYVNFYPTSRILLKKMLGGVSLWKYPHILEPEAGKGDICDYLREQRKELDIECIELNPELAATLRGKGYSVIHDDFLNFEPVYSYDLIVMNPPFDNGAAHLLKALQVMASGGRILCILNAETLKNPCTNQRKSLCLQLADLNAQIEYEKMAFSSAERSTNVEVAVIDVTVPPQKGVSLFYEKMKTKYIKDEEYIATDLVETDAIKDAVAHYNMEVEAGIALIREYKALAPYIINEFKSSYAKPILQLKIGGKDCLSEKLYVMEIRRKYWTVMFQNEYFTKAMTCEQRNHLSDQVRELIKVDFSYSNIKEIQSQMCKHMVSGIEQAILNLFETLTVKHAWYPECERNIHYYNGWASNKAWYVNSKVVLPVNGYDTFWKKFRYSYNVSSTISDIDHAFDYLAGCPGASSNSAQALASAETNGQSKAIRTKYMSLTFYKKGTMHVEFTDLDVLKCLNIFAGRYYNMLPPRYGKVHFDEMTPEEQAVVKEFDGSREEYEKVYEERDYYLLDISPSMLSLETA